MEKFFHLAELFDIYGELLTEKQQKCLSMHFYDDLSLSEIAENFSISRQAVYDLMKRAEDTMTSYDSKLHLLDKRRALMSRLEDISRKVRGMSTKDNAALTDEILSELERRDFF